MVLCEAIDSPGKFISGWFWGGSSNCLFVGHIISESGGIICLGLLVEHNKCCSGFVPSLNFVAFQLECFDMFFECLLVVISVGNVPDMSQACPQDKDMSSNCEDIIKWPAMFWTFFCSVTCPQNGLASSHG